MYTSINFLLAEKCMLCKTEHKPNSLQELEPGDHIQIPGRNNLYYHHAIVVDVTNIRKDGRRADIKVIDVPRKAKEGIFTTKDIVTETHLLLKDKQATKCVDITRLDYRKRRHDKPTTLMRAQNAQPKGKYQLFFNNCEHFATACVSGINANDARTFTNDNNRVSEATYQKTQYTNPCLSYLDVQYATENEAHALNKIPDLNTSSSEPINETDIDNNTNNSRIANDSRKSKNTDAHNVGKLSNGGIDTIEADIRNDMTSQSAEPQHDKNDNNHDNAFDTDLSNSKSTTRASYKNDQHDNRHYHTFDTNLNNSKGTTTTAPKNDKHDNKEDHTVNIDNSVSSQAAACFWRFINVCLLLLQLGTYVFNFYIYAIFVGKDETFDHFDDSLSMWMRQKCYNPSITFIGFRTTCDWVVLAVFLGLFALILCVLVCRQRQLNREKLVCKQCYKSTCCIYGFRLLMFLIVDMFNNFCERYLYRLLSWLDFSSAFTVFIIITLALVEGLYIYFVSHYLAVTLFYVLGTRKCKALPVCGTCCGTEIEEDSFEYVTIHF